MRQSFKSCLILGQDSLLGQALEREIPKTHPQMVVHGLTHDELQSLPQEALTIYVRKLKPELVINVFTRGGGILKNKRSPADMFMKNVSLEMFFLPACHSAGVQKYVNVLPNCIYPDGLEVPFCEADLWKGYPEETVSYYALTKKLLAVQASAFRKQFDFNGINLIVTASYGPHDAFHPNEAQVIPSMISRFSAAVRDNVQKLDFWGTGNATREFIYCDDAARAILKAAFEYNDSKPINISSKTEIKIKQLAEVIAEACGFKGELGWDATKPEGILRKCLSNDLFVEKFGPLTLTPIEEGIKNTLKWYNSEGREQQEGKL